MQLTEIRTDARYMISPQLTSTEYTDAALDRNANHWLRKVFGWAVVAQGDWQVGGDTIYRDLAVGTTKYTLPTSLVRIFKGEILYTTGGSSVPLTFRDLQPNQGSVEGNTTRTIDDFGAPTADLNGVQIEVRPAPTEVVANGLKLWVQLSLAELVDGTDEPQFMEILQRVISKGAAMDYCEAEEMWSKFRELKYEIFGDPRVPGDLGIRGEIEALYSIRSGAKRDGLAARRRSYR